MRTIANPAPYNTWYHAPRGACIAEIEFSPRMSLLCPAAGIMLLGAGCGNYLRRRIHSCNVFQSDTDLGIGRQRHALAVPDAAFDGLHAVGVRTFTVRDTGIADA